MPSGYTSDIYYGKEISGKDFIMKCARAFGALIEMRDDPLDAEIPFQFNPSPYYSEKLEKAKAEIEKYKAMSREEIQAEIETEYEERVAYAKKAIDERLALKARYEKVLSEVVAWNPPTPDHVNLKDYCIKQLKESIDYDCDVDYYMRPIIKLEPEEWLQQRIQTCKREIQFAEEQNRTEIERIKERNAWINQLRASLA